MFGNCRGEETKTQNCASPKDTKPLHKSRNFYTKEQFTGQVPCQGQETTVPKTKSTRIGRSPPEWCPQKLHKTVSRGSEGLPLQNPICKQFSRKTGRFITRRNNPPPPPPKKKKRPRVTGTQRL